MAIDEIELIRYRNKPEKIKILFVGESRPVNGTFFYNQNSNLYKNTKKAFDDFYQINRFSLDCFKSLGCWLYDICNQPMNHLNAAARTEEIRSGIFELENLIRFELPNYIVVCKKGSVRNLIQHSNIMANYQENENIFFLPFPTCGRQKEYREQLIVVLEEIGMNKDN
jgi:hypothetical protein